jgi:predicted SprT family Zn-dependent metalloprotease
MHDLKTLVRLNSGEIAINRTIGYSPEVGTMNKPKSHLLNGGYPYKTACGLEINTGRRYEVFTGNHFSITCRKCNTSLPADKAPCRVMAEIER